jgi:class 3 adenylate cyclase
MSWTEGRARARIDNFRSTIPEGDIRVEEFARYVAERQLVVGKAADGRPPEPIWQVPRNRAVTTHGVHVYANLIDYNDKLADAGRETEASHALALQFLSAHYAACDRLIAAFGIQRVDFHGSRLHAVVLNPAGAEHEGERIALALAFAAAFREMTARTSARFGAGFQTAVRIGVDSGPAVAVNSGRRGEPEPLFIGSPANHAAKLADGAEAGVFLSPRVQRARNGGLMVPQPQLRFTDTEEAGQLTESLFPDPASRRGRDRLEAAFSAFVADREALALAADGQDPGAFRFHYRCPPLRTIDFADHPPSNTIRMRLASIFADIDGFTAYIDQAIAQGHVAQAVANLHVLRGETAAVLRDDFGGRKVRFIGDCLHGVIAEGTIHNIDDAATVRAAVLAASGVRSSFELCRQLLPGIGGLGIAIGIELGPTPICRLGLRGEASVRCSSSRATCASEAEQRRCDGHETAIGPEAFARSDILIQHLFRVDRRVAKLTHFAAQLLLQATPPQPMAPRLAAAPMRAHLRL